MPTGAAYSSGHLVPSLLDLHMFHLLRPILFRTGRYLSDYALRISLGTFSILPFITCDIQKNVTNERFIDCLQHQIVTYYYNVTKNLHRLCLSAKYTSWTANTMFLSLRGQPFDSEGGGGWHILEINILVLKIICPLLEKINNLTFTFLELGKTWQFFQKFSAPFARIGLILK